MHLLNAVPLTHHPIIPDHYHLLPRHKGFFFVCCFFCSWDTTKISIYKTSIKPFFSSFYGIVSFHHLSVLRWQDTSHPTSHPSPPQATGLGAAKGPDGESMQRTCNGWLDDTFINDPGACCVIYGRGGGVDQMGVRGGGWEMVWFGGLGGWEGIHLLHKTHETPPWLYSVWRSPKLHQNLSF